MGSLNRTAVFFAYSRIRVTWFVLRGAVIIGHDPSPYGLAVFDKFDPTIPDEKYKYEVDEETRCGCF